MLQQHLLAAQEAAANTGRPDSPASTARPRSPSAKAQRIRQQQESLAQIMQSNKDVAAQQAVLDSSAAQLETVQRKLTCRAAVLQEERHLRLVAEQEVEKLRKEVQQQGTVPEDPVLQSAHTTVEASRQARELEEQEAAAGAQRTQHKADKKTQEEAAQQEQHSAAKRAQAQQQWGAGSS